MKFKHFPLLLLLLSWVVDALPQKQPFLFDKITRSNGRSLGPVMAIEQDANGFMWFATREGLYRFDGYQNRLFQHNPDDSTSLPFNNITYMYQDTEGILWLRHYDKIQTFNKEKRVYDYQKITKHSFDFNAKIVEDRHNNLWVGPGDKGLVKYSKNSDTVEYYRKYPESYSPDIIEHLKEKARQTKTNQLKVEANNRDTTIFVTIRERGDYLILSSCEIQNQELFDSGWMTHEKDTIWEIDLNKVKHAGGSQQNKLQIDVINLKKGTYQLHFSTDNSHSPEKWRGDPPDKTPFYGIGLFNIENNQTFSWQKAVAQPYIPPNTLSSNQIKDLITDKEGVLWILTNNGLEYYNQNTNKFSSIPINYSDFFGEGFSANHLTFLRDHENDFWIGTESGLLRFNPATGQHETYQNTLENKPLTDNLIINLFEDKDRRLWVATNNGINLYIPAEDAFHHYLPNNDNNLYSNQIITFYQDNSDNFWVATREGLNKLRSSKFKHHSTGIERFGDFPVVSDSSNNLWYRGEENNLINYSRKNKRKVHHLLPQNLFPSVGPEAEKDYMFNDMTIGEKGKIWIATGNSFFSFNPRDKKNSKKYSIRAVSIGKDSIRNNISYISAETPEKIILFCTDHIAVFNPSLERFGQPVKFQLDYDNIYELDRRFVKDVLRCRNGKYWIRTSAGISLWNPLDESLQQVYRFATSVPGMNINRGNIEEGPEGNIWFSFSPNLVKINPENFKSTVYDVPFERDLGKSSVYTDTSGVWIYTNNGLFHYSPASGRLETYSTKSGLPGNTINGITRDNRGNIWLTSLKGLTKLNSNKKSTEAFFTRDNYPAYHFRGFPKRVEGNPGEMLFFSSVGFLSHYPDSINTHAPPVKITEFSVHGEPQQFDTLLYNKKSISLRYDQNHFSMGFTGLDYTEPMDNQYAYQLQGIDKDWIFTNSMSREAKYTTVPPGKYTFRVKSANNDGVWNNEGVSLFIRVAPPWYRTTLAYLVYILLAIGLVYAYIKYKERKLVREKRVLEQKVKERTIQIENQKTQITEQRDQIVEQNKDIRDSIVYAHRIQTAVMPPEDLLYEWFPDHFIYLKPYGIVSGDFYWMSQVNNQLVLAAADCTGHGVPGAFMSMLGIAFLNEIVNKTSPLQANIILNQLREHVITLLNQNMNTESAKDGMDINLCVIDYNSNKLQYAGAYNSLYLIRDNQLQQIKADRMPIGQYVKQLPFTNHEVEIQKGDRIYMFSDGYADQFSEKTMEKFKIKRFKQLLLDIHQEPMQEQKEILDMKFNAWKGAREQIDDVLIIGVKF